VKKLSRQLFKHGCDNNISEVMRDGLQLRITEIRKLIEEGRNDPRPPVDSDAVFNRLIARLIAKYEAMANDRESHRHAAALLARLRGKLS
jgi:hypothetical protein